MMKACQCTRLMEHAGTHHWCVFHHQPADGAELLAAAEGRAHLHIPPRPDLCARGKPLHMTDARRSYNLQAHM